MRDCPAPYFTPNPYRVRWQGRSTLFSSLESARKWTASHADSVISYWNGAEWEQIDPPPEVKVTHHERVSKYLQDHPASTARAIVEALPLGRTTVENTLLDLINRGQVEREKITFHDDPKARWGYRYSLKTR